MLYDVAGRRAGGELRDPVRRGQHRARGRRRHDRRDRAHGAHRAGGGRPSWRRPGWSARSSTRAPPARWTPTRSWSRWRTPAGWSWWTRPTRAARSPPTSRRSVAQEAFGSLRAPIQMVTGAAHAGAVRGLAGGPLHPGRGADRRGGQDGRWTGAMTDERILRVTMPKWGLSMKTGKIVEWFVAEGDTIAKGDDVVDIETDKIAGTPGVAGRRAAPADHRRAGRGPAGRGRARRGRAGRGRRRRRRRGRRGGEGGDRVRGAGGGRGSAAAARRGRRADDLLLDAGRRAAASPWCWCTGSAATRTRGCSCSSRCREDRAVTCSTCPGTAPPPRTSATGRWTTLAGVVTGFLDALGIERAHLVGHSLGGAVVAAVAKAAPDRVASLTLLAPGGLRRARPTRSTCAGSPPRRPGASSSRCSGGCSPTSRW